MLNCQLSRQSIRGVISCGMSLPADVSEDMLIQSSGCMGNLRKHWERKQDCSNPTSTLKMEAALSCEPSVNFYQIKWRQFPEASQSSVGRYGCDNGRFVILHFRCPLCNLLFICFTRFRVFTLSRLQGIGCRYNNCIGSVWVWNLIFDIKGGA
jgi:hypothetical protein